MLCPYNGCTFRCGSGRQSAHKEGDIFKCPVCNRGSNITKRNVNFGDPYWQAVEQYDEIDPT